MAKKQSIEQAKEIRNALIDETIEMFKINPKSKKIAEQIQLEPIHKRYTKILEQAELHTKVVKEEREKLLQLREQEEYDGQFKPKIDVSQKVVQGKRQDPLFAKSINEDILMEK